MPSPLPSATRSGRLAGRSCLIVGGTGGIGIAMAVRFLREGARVVVAGQASLLAEVHDLLKGLGPMAERPVHVEDEDSVAALFAESRALLGSRLDVLVHVAGISGRRLGDGPLHDCSTQ